MPRRRTQSSKIYSQFESLIKSKAPTQKLLSSIAFYTRLIRQQVRSLEDVPLEKLYSQVEAVMQSVRMFRTCLNKASWENSFENASLRDLEWFCSLAIKPRPRIGSSPVSSQTLVEILKDSTSLKLGPTDTEG